MSQPSDQAVNPTGNTADGANSSVDNAQDTAKDSPPRRTTLVEHSETPIDINISESASESVKRNEPPLVAAVQFRPGMPQANGSVRSDNQMSSNDSTLPRPRNIDLPRNLTPKQNAQVEKLIRSFQAESSVVTASSPSFGTTIFDEDLDNGEISVKQMLKPVLTNVEWERYSLFRAHGFIYAGKINKEWCRSRTKPKFVPTFLTNPILFIDLVLNYGSAFHYEEYMLCRIFLEAFINTQLHTWAISIEETEKTLSWKLLVDQFMLFVVASTNFINRNSMVMDIVKSANETMTSFVERFCAAAATSSYPDAVLIDLLKRRLPPELLVPLDRYNGTSCWKIYSTAVIHTLSTHPIFDKPPVTVLGKRADNLGRTPPNNPKKKACFTCGKPNHLSKDCWHNKTSQNGAQSAANAAKVPQQTGQKNSVKSHSNWKNKNKNSKYLLNTFSDSDTDPQKITLSDVDHDRSKSYRPFLPITVKGENIWAVLDTCADYSFIDKKLLIKMKLVKAIDKLAKPVTFKSAINEEILIMKEDISLPIQLDSRTVLHRVCVVENLIEPFIVGNDLYPLLGITIRGIPSTFGGPKINRLDIDEGLASKNAALQKEYPQAVRDSILTSLKKCLDANSALNVGITCNDPNAVVFVDTDMDPESRKNYRIPQSMHERASKIIQDWLLRGIIEPAAPDCPWNWPVICAPKKDANGNWNDVRVCVDYRILNKNLKDEAFSIPLIGDLLHATKGFVIASTIDLKAYFNQLPVNRDDRPKTAFTWNNVKYQFAGAPFGLKHLPKHAQKVLTRILAPHAAFCRIFIDDVIIFSASIEEHICHLRLVISTLTEHGLKIALDKSKIGFRVINYLGYMTDGEHIDIDRAKIESFMTIPKPRSAAQLRSFLGVCNYLREFIPLYSKVVAPLEAIKCKKIRFDKLWNHDCDKSFIMIQKILQNRPVLNYPDFSLPYVVATDASDFGVGAVLFQEVAADDGNTVRKYIQFASSALTKSQRNYPVLQKELLAIVFAITKFHEFLYGNKFVVHTDHEALRFLFSRCNDNRMLSYWHYLLGEYNFDVVYIPGIWNVFPDALSRLYSDQTFDVDLSAEKEVFKADVESIGSGDPMMMDIDTVEVEHRDRLMPMMVDDKPLNAASTLRSLISDCFDKVSPDTKEERMAILHEVHDTMHQGAYALQRAVWRKGFFWQGITKDCKSVVMSCKRCLAVTVFRNGFHPLKTITHLYPMDFIGCDTFSLGNDVVSNGFARILILTCYATSFTFLRPIVSATALNVIAEMSQVFNICGWPSKMRIDGGSEFGNHDFMEFCKGRHIETTSSPPYHHQGNGKVESHVGLAVRLFSKFLDNNWSDWFHYVGDVQFSMNQRASTRHGSTPFSLMFCRQPNFTKEERNLEGRTFNVDDWESRADELINVVFPAVAKRTAAYNNKMKAQFERAHRIIDGFEVGSYVYRLDVHRTKKSEDKFAGPYCVVARLDDGGYVLRDVTGTLFPSSVTPEFLKPALVSEEENLANQAEIKEILAHRGRKGNYEYKIAWKNGAAPEWVHQDDVFAATEKNRYWASKRRVSSQKRGGKKK
jgi:hypothetical protein